MKQLFIQFISACAVTWAMVFALGLGGCIQSKSAAYHSITSQPKQIKVLRMPATHSLKKGVSV